MSLLVPMLVLATFATPSSREPRYFQSAARAVPAGASAQDAERWKIRQHLRAVEETLREETPPDLSAAQREARVRAMDALNEYWVRGQFPINEDAPRRTPVFIDNRGIPCAMGYLLLASGANALAREIATYENNDYVPTSTIRGFQRGCLRMDCEPRRPHGSSPSTGHAGASDSSRST